MSNEKNALVCPVIPMDDRLVLLITRLSFKGKTFTGKDGKKISIVELDRKITNVLKVVGVGPGLANPDGTSKPMRFAVGDLVLLGPSNVARFYFEGEEYAVVRDFEIMAKIKFDAVEDKSNEPLPLLITRPEIQA